MSSFWLQLIEKFWIEIINRHTLGKAVKLGIRRFAWASLDPNTLPPSARVFLLRRLPPLMVKNPQKCSCFLGSFWTTFNNPDLSLGIILVVRGGFHFNEIAVALRIVILLEKMEARIG